MEYFPVPYGTSVVSGVVAGSILMDKSGNPIGIYQHFIDPKTLMSRKCTPSLHTHWNVPLITHGVQRCVEKYKNIRRVFLTTHNPLTIPTIKVFEY